MAAEKITNPDLWKEFYKTAAQFRDLAPWRWMTDSDIFGVQHPDTGQIGWCCIMGKAGEHFALAVYRGTDGLESYENLADSADLEAEFNPERFNTMYSQNCWMIAFEDATRVPPHQKKFLKDLGLSFRGAGQWIVAETYDPGFLPWFLEEKDLPYLIQCLQQAMDVAFRYEDSPGLLDREELLVRVPKKEGVALVWEDKFMDEDDLPEATETQPVVPSPQFLKKVRAMPEIQGAVAISNFLTPTRIQENKNKRPWSPMLVLAIEPGSGYIIMQDAITISELPQKLEGFLLKLYQTVEGKPNQIVAHSLLMCDLLSEICDELDIELIELSGDEPFFSDVAQAMISFLH